jgi:DNA replication protein DnaC
MGPPGCGKTWDCSAIWAWMHGKVGDMYYYREPDFLARLRVTMNTGGEWQQEIIYLLDHDLIIIDDIGSAGEGKTGWRQDVFFIASNNRYESKKPTVFSTNYNEEEIKEKLGHRVHSRLFAKEHTIINMFGYPDLRQEL